MKRPHRSYRTSLCGSIALILVLVAALSALQTNAASGGIDPTFGSGGAVRTNFSAPGMGGASAVAVQSDNKIVVVGRSRAPQSSGRLAGDFSIARFNQGGAPDISFAGGGGAASDFFGNDDAPFAVAIQPDGKILVGGYVTMPQINTNYAFGMVRYLPDGTLDTSFGTSGKVVTDLNTGEDEIRQILLDSDGKIIAAGWSSTTNGGGRQFVAVRYTSSGSLDSTFGAGGVASVPFGFDAYALNAAFQPDGKILLSGTARVAENNSSYPYVALARLTASGAVDTSFNGSGKLLMFRDGNGGTAAIQSDGKIVVAGGTSSTTSAMARLLPDGTPDTTFGTNGQAPTPVTLTRLLIDSEGKITGISGYEIGDFKVYRYEPDGSPDTGFGSGGLVTTDLGNTEVASDLSFSPPAP